MVGVGRVLRRSEEALYETRAVCGIKRHIGDKATVTATFPRGVKGQNKVGCLEFLI